MKYTLIALLMMTGCYSNTYTFPTYTTYPEGWVKSKDTVFLNKEKTDYFYNIAIYDSRRADSIRNEKKKVIHYKREK